MDRFNIENLRIKRASSIFNASVLNAIAVPGSLFATTYSPLDRNLKPNLHLSGAASIPLRCISALEGSVLEYRYREKD